MSTVITNFYNEEYLLPWWINHHKKIFDNGIMIDYNSTDRSLEICKELCPSHWKIVNHDSNFFEAYAADELIKDYEKKVSGFKISLNTTEFLLPIGPLEIYNDILISNNKKYIKSIGVCMVDVEPHVIPTYDISLVIQKYHGMIEGYKAGPTYSNYNMKDDYFLKLFGRYYHNDNYGKYTIGRHELTCENEDVINSDNLFTLKYKWSPWNENSIKRIQQFKDRIPDSDVNQRIGIHMQLTEHEYKTNYEHYLKTAYDLKRHHNFSTALEYFSSL